VSADLSRGWGARGVHVDVNVHDDVDVNVHDDVNVNVHDGAVGDWSYS
jgi:hypothetical protein